MVYPLYGTYKSFSEKRDHSIKLGLNGEKPGLDVALVIASTALFHQKDRYGNDYSLHYLRVAFKNTLSLAKQCIGVLHDVVEDTDWEPEDLREVGFSGRIVDGIDSVTKRPGEKYFDFIERCSLNEDGQDVKIGDLNNNTSMSRNEKLMTLKEMMKTQAYIVSYQYLVAVKKQEITAGMKMTEFMESRPGLYDESLLREYSSHYKAA